MMTRFVGILTVILCLQYSVSAQKATVQGKITDSKGEAIPFATIHIKGTTLGTSANMDGFYSLSVIAGVYEIVVQYPSYQSLTKKITLLSGETQNVDFVLKEETTDIESIMVQAKAVNYADEVIKNAQRNRKSYLEERPDYQCQVYIKGLVKLLTKPKEVFGESTAGLDTGIVYLSESISEVSYQRSPRKYKEVVIASKVSGDSKGFSFNQAASWNFNFYENLVGQGLSERGLVSPIANTAFLYYNYKWEGQFTEDSLVVNKIKVIPKRNTDPVWEGYIYITEGTWRIHSLDLSFDKNRPVDFIKEGRIKQVFTKPNAQTEWVLLSQTFYFGFKLLGFGGNGYFTKIYADYNLKPDFTEKHFGRDLIIVEKESNKKDSVFWQKMRPVPLLAVEKEDYRKKDSLEIIQNSPRYKDSIDKINNRFKYSSLLFGYTYRNSHKKYSLGFASPLNEVSFNTVEGLVLNLRLAYQRQLEENREIEITPTFRYGFSSKDFYGKIRLSYLSTPKKYERWTMEAGKFVEQFNPDAILPAVNTTTTLYWKDNFMKIYEKTFGMVQYRREVGAGLILNTSLEYSQRKSLENTTDYTWSKNENKAYTSNAPLNRELEDTSFGTNNALLWNATLTFTPKQRYINRPDARIRLSSKYPTFVLNYTKGIPTLGSEVDFDKIELAIRDNYRLGLAGAGSYRVFGGSFLNKKALTFIDYQHFEGNRTILAFPSFRAFQLIDYYAFSTSKRYGGGSLEHHFNGFFFNGIPLLKKTRIQEVFTLNYLFTETNGNYIEIGAGIEHILKILRVDYFWGFLDGKSFNNGLRIGIGF
jgi:hypothetical protein